MADEATSVQDNTAPADATPASTQEPAQLGGMFAGDKKAESTPTSPLASTESTTTEEPKAAEAPADAPKAEGAKSLLSSADKEEGAPEKYDAFNLPEGFGDDNDQATLSAIAKGMGLTQADAQKGAEFAVKAVQNIDAELKAAQEKWQQEQVNEWNAIPNNKELSILANKGLEKMGLKDHFQQRGYDFDSKLMQLAASYGRSISEAKALSGGDAPTTSAKPLYDPQVWK